MAELLHSAARRFGPPRHLVTDRGAQFTSKLFARAVAALRVRHRFGAVGRTGSIAIIERFFRTLKDTATLRPRPPLLLADLTARLGLSLAYYTWLRPHSALGNRTPAEVLLDMPVVTTRARPTPTRPTRRTRRRDRTVRATVPRRPRWPRPALLGPQGRVARNRLRGRRDRQGPPWTAGSRVR
jgi:hypothetical protein